MRAYAHQELYIRIFIAATFIIAPSGKQPKSPSRDKQLNEIVVCLYRKENWKIASLGNSIDESQEHNGEQKKPAIEEHTFHDSICKIQKQAKGTWVWEVRTLCTLWGWGWEVGMRLWNILLLYIKLFSLWKYIELCTCSMHTFLYVCYTLIDAFLKLLGPPFLICYQISSLQPSISTSDLTLHFPVWLALGLDHYFPHWLWPVSMVLHSFSWLKASETQPLARIPSDLLFSITMVNPSLMILAGQ